MPNVIISSIPLKGWLLDLLPRHIRPPASKETDDSSSFLLCLASSRESSLPPTVHAACVPLLPGYFSGVGDLFSALVLAHYQPDSPDPNHRPTSLPPLAHAVSIALTKTHAILQLTYDYALSLPEEERLPTDDERDEDDPDRRVRRMRGRELRLIQGQEVLRGEATSGLRKLEKWDGFWS